MMKFDEIDDKLAINFGLQITAALLLTKMSRFLVGDQLGNIKVLRYSHQEKSVDIKTVHRQETTPASSVEHLAINYSTSNDQTTVRRIIIFGS
jgi:hypothetical protein